MALSKLFMGMIFDIDVDELGFKRDKMGMIELSPAISIRFNPFLDLKEAHY